MAERAPLPAAKKSALSATDANQIGISGRKGATASGKKNALSATDANQIGISGRKGATASGKKSALSATDTPPVSPANFIQGTRMTQS